MSIQETTLSCSLTDAEMKERRKLVRAELLPKMNSFTELSNGLEVIFPADLSEKVSEFVELEQACCGFLSFDTNVSGNEFHLSVTGPENAKETLKLFVSAFSQ